MSWSSASPRLCGLGPAFAIIDPWILACSAVTVIATIWMGFWAARKSKTAGDFFVAGRSVSVGWNASAISGEYLSAASFMGVAGMVMSSGYDALWYPVCYACGYLFLLLFIAGPLRRFGAYTIPDFAEGRFDSPLFRKIAVVFVLFIGFFYTMPQMKGAGTTLAYVFQDVDLRGGWLEFLAPHNAAGEAIKGFPYSAGVLIVGAVITLNVALGGMKGITLVQAFQYWLKMFAISVPIFVLMTVYGHYGKQLGSNAPEIGGEPKIKHKVEFKHYHDPAGPQTLGEKAQVKFIGSAVPELIPKDLVMPKEIRLQQSLYRYALYLDTTMFVATNIRNARIEVPMQFIGQNETPEILERIFQLNEVVLVKEGEVVKAVYRSDIAFNSSAIRHELPEKAPTDATWLSPFGPLTTKAAKAAAAARTKVDELVTDIPLKAGTPTNANLFVALERAPISQALGMYGELVGRSLPSGRTATLDQLDRKLNFLLTRLHLLEPPRYLPGEFTYRNTNPVTAGQLKSVFETAFKTNGISVIGIGDRYFQAVPTKTLDKFQDETRKTRVAALAKTERAYALLYTYSLIIALVCGTAGLPHILVRFYTNPDGVAAKRTTMWVMILIGVFYLFPPIFGVMGRNLLPELYSGVGAKGTDKVVLELPRILNQNGSATVPVAPSGVSPDSPRAEEVSAKTPKPAGETPALPEKKRIPWGSILSGITCAGAFAAFMSTFSGLLVSMTGALAHDVYGRMLRPKSTSAERMRMFKWCAVIVGGIAILLGSRVEKLEINFMVGQAFAIAAASYFPLLFMSVWWRKLTMKGAAAGTLTGGLLALLGISLTSFTTLGLLKWDGFWAAHPLLRILCEQPAIWAVPLAITLMVVVSKLTAKEIPADIRMKMLVLHAPEKLGLKQEYIQEHQHGH